MLCRRNLGGGNGLGEFCVGVRAGLHLPGPAEIPAWREGLGVKGARGKLFSTSFGSQGLDLVPSLLTDA